MRVFSSKNFSQTFRHCIKNLNLLVKTFFDFAEGEIAVEDKQAVSRRFDSIEGHFSWGRLSFFNMNNIVGDSMANTGSHGDAHEGNGPDHPAAAACRRCAVIAGACAGGVGIVVGQPFDTLKVRMQVGHDLDAAHHIRDSKESLLARVRSMYRYEVD